MSEEKKFTDAENNAEWTLMLKAFHEFSEKKPLTENDRLDLAELQQLAVSSSLLSPRQVEGIYERCGNVLDGSYGRNLSKIAS